MWFVCSGVTVARHQSGCSSQHDTRPLCVTLMCGTETLLLAFKGALTPGRLFCTVPKHEYTSSPDPRCPELTLPRPQLCWGTATLHVSSHRSTTCALLYFIVKRTLRAVGAQWRPTQRIRLSLYQPCVCWVVVFVDTTVVKHLQKEMVAWVIGHFQHSVTVPVHKSLYRAAVHLFQLCGDKEVYPYLRMVQSAHTSPTHWTSNMRECALNPTRGILVQRHAVKWQLTCSCCNSTKNPSLFYTGVQSICAQSPWDTGEACYSRSATAAIGLFVWHSSQR